VNDLWLTFSFSASHGNDAGDHESVLRTHDVIDALNRKPPLAHLVDEKLGAGALWPRAPVRADDEPSACRDDAREESLRICPPPRMRNVYQLRSHEVEPHRRFPHEGVADEDSISPVRQPDASQFRQLLRDVETVGLDAVTVLASPNDDALHKQTAGATDVEERSVALDRGNDGPAKTLPVAFVPPEARLLSGIAAGEVLRFMKCQLFGEEPVLTRG